MNSDQYDWTLTQGFHLIKPVGNETQRISGTGGTAPRYTLQRQANIGDALTTLTGAGVIAGWTWLYTDKSRAYYEVEFLPPVGTVVLDTQAAEFFLLGVSTQLEYEDRMQG